MPKLLNNIAGREIRITGHFPRIARLEADRYHFLSDPVPVIESLRGRADLFTFIQSVADPTPHFSYSMEVDNYAAIPISSFDDWWKSLNFKARNKAKQAEKKGVILKEVPFDDDLMRGIRDIYNECPVRQGRPFLHYGKDMDTVRRISATFMGHSFFLGAYFDGELIGFAKLTTDESQTVASTMHIISMIQHRDKAPTNGLIVQAMRSCAERGLKYLVYASFAYGNKKPDSVAEFKERMGFQKIEVPRYYVPLNASGALALKLGLHHRLRDRIPEQIVARLRALRNKWYETRAVVSEPPEAPLVEP
jgi:hypothetical protein